jgi:hypothetical protein
MNITPDELEVYKTGEIVLTRSFLSTSKNKLVAERLWQSMIAENNQSCASIK